MLDQDAVPANYAAVTQSVIERHSIDYIPHSERKGVAWHQGPFWFGGNFILLTLAAGFLGPVKGLTTGWSILAIVGGVCFGTFFMAFHANQGPRLGLPQMIQSRAQLGLQGAVFSLTAAVLVYIGFIIFNIILVAEVVKTQLPGSNWLWYPLAMLAALIIAIIGHDLLHFVQRWIAFIIIVFYAVFTVYAIVTLHSHPSVSSVSSPLGFNWTGFLTMFSVAAGYQITYAVYVSDYSRYLPVKVSARALIVWTYVGAAASAIWLMSLGAFIASRLKDADAVSSVVSIGDNLFPHFGTIMVFASIPSMVGIMAVNSYGAMLSGVSAIDGFRKLQPTLTMRVTGLIVIDVICVAAALAIPNNYLGTFNNFITIVLYFLVPWTAVNLVDFYFIRHGHYAISEIFNPHGMYKRWPVRGVASYLIGLGCMVPFIVVFGFEGPVAKLLGGVDVSFLVGLAVAGGLYYLLNRGRDFSVEIARATELNASLEKAFGGNEVRDEAVVI